jgi:cysteine-rich repeat protein
VGCSNQRGRVLHASILNRLNLRPRRAVFGLTGISLVLAACIGAEPKLRDFIPDNGAGAAGFAAYSGGRPGSDSTSGAGAAGVLAAGESGSGGFSGIGGQAGSAAAPGAVCPNGVVELGEQCDDGNRNDNDACRNNCRSASCGDGVVWLGVEECDDGNTSNTDSCTNMCMLRP